MTKKNIPVRKTVDGNSIIFLIDGVRVAGQKSASLNRNTGTVDVTTKDAEGWTENEVGQNDWSGDFDGLINLADEGWKKLKEAQNSRTPVFVKYGNSQEWEEGWAIISSLSDSAPANDRCTYTCSIIGMNALVMKTAEQEEDEDLEESVQIVKSSKK